MHRTVIIVMGVALVLAPPVGAQKKQKDQVLQQYLIEEFGKLNTALTQLADRLSALETELNRVKQQQGDIGSELRSTQNLLKTTDTSLSSFRLSTQQELLGLKTDLTQIRQTMTVLEDLIKKGAGSAPAPPPAAAPAIEGYITEVRDSEVKINLGSGMGVKVGTRFNVYRASDPLTQIGVIEVTSVVDANNSLAKIVMSKPDTKFEFSDIVRPI